MKVLVVNCGSSSLKYQLIDSETEKLLERAKTETGFDGNILKTAHPALKNRAAAMILENFGFSFDFEHAAGERRPMQGDALSRAKPLRLPSVGIYV